MRGLFPLSTSGKKEKLQAVFFLSFNEDVPLLSALGRSGEWIRVSQSIFRKRIPKGLSRKLGGQRRGVWPREGAALGEPFVTISSPPAKRLPRDASARPGVCVHVSVVHTLNRSTSTGPSYIYHCLLLNGSVVVNKILSKTSSAGLWTAAPQVAVFSSFT